MGGPGNVEGLPHPFRLTAHLLLTANCPLFNLCTLISAPRICIVFIYIKLMLFGENCLTFNGQEANHLYPKRDGAVDAYRAGDETLISSEIPRNVQGSQLSTTITTLAISKCSIITLVR